MIARAWTRCRALLGLVMLVACGPQVGSSESTAAEGTGAGDETGGSSSASDTRGSGSSGGPTGDGTGDGSAGATGPGMTSNEPLDTSTGGEGLSPPCLPPGSHGPLIPELSRPGLNVYEACGSALSLYLVEHVGSELMLSLDQIDEVREQTQYFPGQAPGLFGVGTGLCCNDLDEACVIFMVEEPEPAMPALSDYIEGAVPEGYDVCFGVAILVAEPPTPG